MEFCTKNCIEKITNIRWYDDTDDSSDDSENYDCEDNDDSNCDYNQNDYDEMEFCTNQKCDDDQIEASHHLSKSIVIYDF